MGTIFQKLKFFLYFRELMDTLCIIHQSSKRLTYMFTVSESRKSSCFEFDFDYKYCCYEIILTSLQTFDYDFSP